MECSVGGVCAGCSVGGVGCSVGGVCRRCNVWGAVWEV